MNGKQNFQVFIYEWKVEVFSFSFMNGKQSFLFSIYEWKVELSPFHL